MTENKIFWLDNISYPMLIITAVLLGMAPFAGEPHLLEKLKMLFDGQLSRPIDIFDLFMHGAPIILLVWKLLHNLQNSADSSRN